MAARPASAVPVQQRLSPDCSSDCARICASLGFKRVALCEAAEWAIASILAAARRAGYWRIGTKRSLAQRIKQQENTPLPPCRGVRRKVATGSAAGRQAEERDRAPRRR